MLGYVKYAFICSPCLIYIFQVSHRRLYTAMTLSITYNQSEYVGYNNESVHYHAKNRWLQL